VSFLLLSEANKETKVAAEALAPAATNAERRDLCVGLLSHAMFDAPGRLMGAPYFAAP